jgi:hypothetical protein
MVVMQNILLVVTYKVSWSEKEQAAFTFMMHQGNRLRISVMVSKSLAIGATLVD